tara:strand:+ start:370 stop:921 length:552 start_codon:yes stop_codon:yes gene_type:complete
MKHAWWYHENFFDLKTIKEINKIAKEHQDPNTVDAKAKNVSKICDVKIFNYKYVKHLLDSLNEYIDFINQEVFGYDLYPMTSFQTLNHNTYKANVKGHYNYHVDAESHENIATAKITCLINLSEKKYEGGDFYIFQGCDNKVKELNKTGSIIMFPSFLNHKVTPVTKGERISLALWRKGPHFK